ncbi:hypothetical protein HZB07_06800 [Candidatus Saganbacteria bacterium]|nr:hypothetical protein [Candidatus Saganbacteria bacterium]
MLEAYHSNPNGSDPRITTNRIRIAANFEAYNSNSGLGAGPGFTLDYARYLGYLTTDNKIFFVRGSSDTAPGGTVYVRIWSGAANVANSYYSQAVSFANGALVGQEGTLNATTNYRAASPYPPVITQFQEVATTVIPARTRTGTLVVNAQQPATPTDGLREVTRYLWRRGTAADALSDVSGATGQNLSSDLATLSTGTTYYFQTQHTNWFGNASNTPPVNYTIAGAVAAGAGVTVSYTFVRLAGSFGLNQFSLPFVANIGPTPINTIDGLVAQLNAAAGTGSPAITSIGWWNETSQIDQGYTITYSGTTPTFAAVNGANVDPTAERVVLNRSYQVAVSRGFGPVIFTAR